MIGRIVFPGKLEARLDDNGTWTSEDNNLARYLALRYPGIESPSLGFDVSKRNLLKAAEALGGKPFIERKPKTSRPPARSVF